MALLNQAWRIKKYEQEICYRADTILAAPNDKDELVKIGANPSKFFETYHLGDDELLSFPDLEFNATEKALLYIGTLSWEANIDGLIWLYNEIWHLVKQQHPNIKLFIVGKNPDARLKEIAAKDAQIILTGFIKDVEPCFQECNVFISPLRFGSGIKVKEQGKFNALKKFYKESLFFRTLIDNCEMSMNKCFFPLTAFLSDHPVYGEIWNDIYAEYELTKKFLFQLTGKNELMADYPVEQLSIQMRERIVLPLVTIQQYAITRVREMEEKNIKNPERDVFGKLVMRCSFGIINAGRNSA